MSKSENFYQKWINGVFKGNSGLVTVEEYNGHVNIKLNVFNNRSFDTKIGVGIGLTLKQSDVREMIEALEEALVVYKEHKPPVVKVAKGQK